MLEGSQVVNLLHSGFNVTAAPDNQSLIITKESSQIDTEIASNVVPKSITQESIIKTATSPIGLIVLAGLAILIFFSKS